jgi:hypothetical protein
MNQEFATCHDDDSRRVLEQGLAESVAASRRSWTVSMTAQRLAIATCGGFIRLAKIPVVDASLYGFVAAVLSEP